MTLSGCLSAEELRQADLRTDSDTCAGFGAAPGSAGQTRCMLQQQERRDQAQLLNMGKARISSETAPNNLEVLEAIRKGRK